MFAKIEIRGTIEIITGLHIGVSDAFSAIGAVDAPVIRDAVTKLPMIPGSSLKGKMRTLLAKKYNETVVEPDEDAACLIGFFGSAKERKSSRILFSDMFMNNWDELKNQGLTNPTEIKFENSIKRTTAVATPRQIERVVRGATFPMRLLYEMSDEKTMFADFQILRDGFRLLEFDYLGGNGSRGYGRVKISDLEAEAVVGDVSAEAMGKCQEILNN